MDDCSAHHVGITVADLESTLPFYRDTLGFSVTARFEVGGDAFAEGVGVPDAEARFAHLDADGITLELVEYEPTEDPAHAGLASPGAAHVGIEVPDVQDAYESLPDDVPTISPPQVTESGTTICFLRDPEGNLVELLDPA